MKNAPNPTVRAGMTCEQLFDIFPDPRVYVLTSAVGDTALAFMSEPEAASIVDAVPKRQREFATARALAREGLERFFGLHDFNLLNGKNRSPFWPQGIAGSISHSSTRAWVALVDATYGTIGIDGENGDKLERNLWHLILCDEEITYLETLKTSIQERRALVIFSAKEALYKAQFPWSHKYVDFKAVQIRLNEDGTLLCIFQSDIAPFQSGFVASGRWSDEMEVISAVSITSLSSVA
jgi:4'-phosphopantetheinyl transferase EntD